MTILQTFRGGQAELIYRGLSEGIYLKMPDDKTSLVNYAAKPVYCYNDSEGAWGWKICNGAYFYKMSDYRRTWAFTQRELEEGANDD